MDHDQIDTLAYLWTPGHAVGSDLPGWLEQLTGARMGTMDERKTTVT